jgi:hypothetical protein
MANRTKLTTVTAALAAAVALAAAGAPQAQQAPSVMVYKTATCGCCSKWVEHMRSQGFEVKTEDVDNISRVKATHGVPSEVGSCHTSLVGGYVIEGHVPADAVHRLLREKPKVTGIAVAGMPAGSPGMEVPGRKDAYNIVTFDKSGPTGVFEKR